MRISDLAGQANVHIQTIRFYERRRLLREPPRTSGGYRNYSPQDLETVKFIKWAKKLGFTLKEVRRLLPLHSAVATHSSGRSARNSQELQRIVRMAQVKLDCVQERIRVLKITGTELRSMIEKLQCQPNPVCPAAREPRPASKPAHRRSCPAAP